MNFNGLGKFLVIVFIGLGVLMTIPAIFASFFTARPVFAVGIPAVCGALAGRMVSPVKWPVCLGSAAIAASLTISYAGDTFGGGIVGWIGTLLSALVTATATTFVLVMLLPNARNTSHKL